MVNSTRPAEAFSALGDYRIIPINGRQVSHNNGMGKIINSALLGAFVAVLDQPGIEIMCDVIEKTAPAKKQKNVAACREAYRLLHNSAMEVSQ